MSGSASIVTLSPLDFDAVLFDLDGVLTPTASVHAAAWKRMFDEFLQRWSARTGAKLVPFDSSVDYQRYVDGKPRTNGTSSFLESRGIDLPAGSPEDSPGDQTVQGLGKLKDQYFTEYLQQQGITPYEPAVTLVKALRAQAMQTAVVSSSSHCAAVLEAAGIAELFDTRVDGEDITRLRLNGKPAPDSYLEGAKRLAVAPVRAVIVEDAISGVAAGRAGHFGLVIGLDHVGQSRELRSAGADVILTSLAQAQVASEPPSTWVLTYEGFDPAREGMREALCALGNGYFVTRGAAAWAEADSERYPGTYLAGGYNRLRTVIAGRVIENEDLVNFPNWLAVGVKIGTEAWFDERRVRILSYRQELDLRSGTLSRTVRFEHGQARRSTLSERRLVSVADPHLAALELTLTAENWSGPVTLQSALDGRITNSGAQLYRRFNNRHLEPVHEERVESDSLCLLMRTSQSGLQVAEAARTRVFLREQLLDTSARTIQEPGYIGQELTLQIGNGDTIAVEKLVSIYTSRDRAISECSLAARKRIARGERFETALAEHSRVWKHGWRRFDIHLSTARPSFTLNVPLLLRLNMFHLLQTASQHSIGLDIGVPARGWTGEGYQGHIFWDELFIFPTLNLRVPEITRSLLMYRYQRLGEARAAATAAGYQGAMFPWQSGSDGQEQTQQLNLNPRSLRWVPDHSYLQRHIGSAIAWNVWQYFQVTHDTEFLQYRGAELILEIARFWASIARFNEHKGRYEIRGVMGPDEYHEGYPDAPEPGLDNNAYTNIMAVWVLCRALEVLESLSDIRRAELSSLLKLSTQETALWDDISRRMFVPFHDGIISQFEGYEKLAELNWDTYRAAYGNLQRLELILEAEHDSANRYKLSKQADVLMLFYLFSAEELTGLLARLGYAFDPNSIPRTVSYYDSRSSHGSTLSRVVHAWVLARSNRERAIGYFAEALQSDVSDIQQGTTAEGIHLGAMAGTVDLVQRAVTGIEVTGDVLRLNPQLPQEIDCIDMRIRYRGHSLDLRVTRDTLTVSGRERGMAPIRLGLRDEVYEFESGTAREFRL